jgi:hypothetical protein
MQIQSMAQSPSQLWTLQDVVSSNILGITQRYAEFKIGSPAITEHTDHFGIQRNLYSVGGCGVTLGIQKGTVVSVRMFVSANCDLDVSEHFGKPGTKLSQTTFEDWARPGMIHFVEPDGMPPCNGCGEKGDFVFGKIDALGMNGMVEMQLGGGDDEDKVFVRGLDAWKEMLSRAGIDYDHLPLKLYSTAGKEMKECPLRQFDEAAYLLMSKGKIRSIGYGRDNTLQPACNASTDQQFRDSGDFILK